MWLQPSCGRTAARVCYAAVKESGSADSTTITEAGDDREVPGVTGFWCTDGYAVCATLGAVGLNNGTMRRGSVWWC